MTVRHATVPLQIWETWQKKLAKFSAGRNYVLITVIYLGKINHTAIWPDLYFGKLLQTASFQSFIVNDRYQKTSGVKMSPTVEI